MAPVKPAAMPVIVHLQRKLYLYVTVFILFCP